MTPSRLGLAAVILAPALAAAQPGPDGVQPRPYDGPPGAYVPAQPLVRPAQPTPAHAADRSDRKDPQTAGLVSALATGGGLGLMIIGAKMSQNDDNNGTPNSGGSAVSTLGAIGFLIGPTAGHVYAGHTWNAGLGIRLASLGAVVMGVASCSNDGCTDGNGGGAAALIIGGVIGFGVGTVYEVATAPQAARDYNREHGLDLQLSVIPVRDARNTTSPGFGLVGRF